MRWNELLRHTFCEKKPYSPILILCVSLLWAGPLSAVKANEITDQEITTHIESEFWANGSVPSNKIDITTRDGIVTLKGAVDNILAKDRAENIAEATVGVRSVVNRLQVIPPINRTDEDIKKAIDNALLNDPATDSYEVSVTVVNGGATLTGTVQSWQEKQLCTEVTKGVKGVVDVTNNIGINYTSERSDFEIKTEVEKRLANDVRIDDALVNVAVDDEEVRLTGTVGSLQEKNLAHRLAWVTGVDSVNIDGLSIEWWARDEMRRTRRYAEATDEEVKAAVKDAFIYDPRVFSFDIEAYVSDGKVILSGTVDNLEAKKAAEHDAKNTMGVRRVVNNIKVRPETTPSQAELQQRIAKALINDPYIGRFNLNVSVYYGTVYLSGTVHTSWEKERAETVVEGVKGVLTVVNNVKYEHQWTWKPDREIREDVKSQLFWSPFVSQDEINVTVNEGIVTLTGTVDTYSERQSAETNAYQGGAKDVINKLSVNYDNYGPTGYEKPYGFIPY